MAATTAPLYDNIAEEYKESKKIDFREFVEHHTLRQLLAKTHPDLVCTSATPMPITGLAILDLACGEGIYSRSMRRLGASEVLGVDISPEMVALAEKAEAETPLGCEFKVGDASKLDLGAELEGHYDIVLCAWLLQNAETDEQLRGMVADAFRYLKPGGRLVGINDWPGNDQSSVDQRYQVYGFIRVPDEDVSAPKKKDHPAESEDQRKPGTRFAAIVTNPDSTTFTLYFWCDPKLQTLTP